MTGFSIRIFMPDGNPEGLRYVDKSNWSGQGVVCPRDIYAEKRSLEPFQRTGVYVLVGDSEKGILPRIYIGEGDVVADRLDSHHRKKDFWNTAIFFTSKDNSLNKAHVKSLESKLLRLAEEARRCEIEKGTGSNPPALIAADEAEVELFICDMLQCFPLVGLDVFDKPAPRQPTVRKLFCNGPDAKAAGYESGSGMVVEQGSLARVKETDSIHQYMSAIRADLVTKGILQPHAVKKSSYEFTSDFLFKSPSTAAGVVLGRTANGRKMWKDENGVMLKSLQESELYI